MSAVNPNFPTFEFRHIAKGNVILSVCLCIQFAGIHDQVGFLTSCCGAFPPFQHLREVDKHLFLVINTTSCMQWVHQRTKGAKKCTTFIQQIRNNLLT